MGRLPATIDRLSAGCGRIAAWAAIFCVTLVFGLALARYGFGRSSIAAQEAVLWLNATVFLFGLSWALARDQHVRVDIFRQGWSPRRQAVMELAGLALLLLPFCLFTLAISAEYVGESWRIREGSREPGGLPALYLLKSLLPLSIALLLLQGLAQALRALARLRGRA